MSLTPDVLADYACVLLATDHDKFDYGMISEHSQLVIDTRGKYCNSGVNYIVKT